MHKQPDYLAELTRRGRERALIYKTLVLTGLRKGELAALTAQHVELDGPVPYIVLDAADDKAGRGAEIPLRGDLAADLRFWLDVLADAQERARAAGKPIPARLAPNAPLLTVPTGLSCILNRDLPAAGIPKRDERGRTVDVHALRHTFGTHLSKGGVAPRTAQAAMRHSTLGLTMNTYTDPKLLDVAGALNVLPDLPLDDSPRSDRQRATGTDGKPGLLQVSESLVPVLVPNAGNRCTPAANPGKMAAGSVLTPSAVSAFADESRNEVTSGVTLRALGLEPRTYGLKGRCSTD